MENKKEALTLAERSRGTGTHCALNIPPGVASLQSDDKQPMPFPMV
jgi:hypothetical protein